MIELIASEACTACNVCVKACPNNVFDAVAGQAPSIARADDCHTCFLCELYCPVDAIYVSPIDPDPLAATPAQPLTWGSYATASGWRKGLPYLPRTEVTHG